MLLIVLTLSIIFFAVSISIFLLKKKYHYLQSSVMEKRKKKIKVNFPDKSISSGALKVLSKIARKGYYVYAVGGCVRDLLINIIPKDFDVVTDATPEQIVALFKNARIIGRRFKLVHVVFGREVIEVATFRATGELEKHKSPSGRLLSDNTYGSIEEDVLRRDFTVNAIYYDHKKKELIDFCNGVDDVKQRVLRIIGNPSIRYKEDPVRMIRAIRFSCKLGFTLEHEAEKNILPLSYLLDDVPPARKYNEIIKLLHTGNTINVFNKLIKYDLFKYLFPQPFNLMQHDKKYCNFIKQALKNTDDRIINGQNTSSFFLFAVLLWNPVDHMAKVYMKDNVAFFPAMQMAAKKIIIEQSIYTSMPKYVVQAMRDVWDLQNKLEKRKPKNIKYILSHTKFRAAFDFLLLRASSGYVSNSIADWWDKIYQADNKKRDAIITKLIKKNNTKNKTK